jgi:flagellar biosynthetic protein FlhB
MPEETGQERTEQPTPKRLNEARDKGQIARSRELNTTAVLLAGGGGMLMLSGYLMDGLRHIMTSGLSLEREQFFDAAHLVPTFWQAIYSALQTLAPLFTLLVVVALLAPMALGGLSFSAKALSFKWEKLDPIKGFARIFAWRGVMELFKAMAKFALIATVTVIYLNTHVDKLLGLGSMDIQTAIGEVGYLLFWSFFIISTSLLLVAMIDVPFQLWDHSRQLMMTRQEVRDEFKETDGRPEVKQQIRNLQREMAERRMMHEVPRADVVVTNPTHYAVALRYDQDKMRAPIVVAKGADLIAGEIRRLAKESDVPVAAAPALTRALFYSTELNDEIPAGLYLAVAQVLAYIFQLRQKTGFQASKKIELPDLPIPDDLQHD